MSGGGGEENIGLTVMGEQLLDEIISSLEDSGVKYIPYVALLFLLCMSLRCVLRVGLIDEC